MKIRPNRIYRDGQGRKVYIGTNLHSYKRLYDCLYGSSVPSGNSYMGGIYFTIDTGHPPHNPVENTLVIPYYSKKTINQFKATKSLY